MSKLPTLLRGSLRSIPGPAGVSGFTLPCRKIVLEFNDTWQSSAGARDYARQGRLASVAEAWPSVEVVLLEKPHRHPMVRGFYANGREKGISLRNHSISEVTEKVRMLVESSGRKAVHLKNRPVVAGAAESARGVWSGIHGPRR